MPVYGQWISLSRRSLSAPKNARRIGRGRRSSSYCFFSVFSAESNCRRRCPVKVPIECALVPNLSGPFLNRVNTVGGACGTPCRGGSTRNLIFFTFYTRQTYTRRRVEKFPLFHALSLFVRYATSTRSIVD